MTWRRVGAICGLTTLAVVLAVAFWPVAAVTASPGYLSVDVVTVSMQASVNWEQVGYYYLSPWSGNGTAYVNPFYPRVTSNLTTWAAIDLRADPSKQAGWAIVYSSRSGNVTTNVTLLSNNLTATISTAARNALRTATGNSTLAADTIPHILSDILRTKLKPEADGQVRIFLGGQVSGPAPPKYGHGTITESFNQGDSSTLGPNLSWVEVLGGWQTISNQCVGGGVSNENDVYANSALSSANQYVQANVIGIGSYGGGISARHETGGQYDYYSLQCSTGDNYWALHKMYNDADSELATNSTGYSAPSGELWRLEVDGSSLTGKIAGTTKLTVSDGDITGNVYAGLTCFPQGTGSSYYSYFDNFEAGALVVVPAAVTVAPTSINFAYTTGSSQWSSGSEPSWPLDDNECYFTINNTGTVNASITAKAINPTGGVGWTLRSTMAPVSDNRSPTGDNLTAGTWAVFPASPATGYDKVDEAAANGATDFIVGLTVTSGSGYWFFNFTPFSVPSTASVDNVTVWFQAADNASGANNIRAALLVNSICYNATSRNPDTSYVSYNETWTTNPNTASAWTVADVNGSGAHPLQKVGVSSTDFTPDMNVSWVCLVVNYTPALAAGADEVIQKVGKSGDANEAAMKTLSTTEQAFISQLDAGANIKVEVKTSIGQPSDQETKTGKIIFTASAI